VHGWQADVEDEETWEAVVTKAGDYDAAVAMVAEGDSVGSGMVVGAVSEEEFERLVPVVEDSSYWLANDNLTRAVEQRVKWTEETEAKVRDGG
jgi:hypothetical protein